MSYILFQGILLFICNFPTHIGRRPSRFLMSVIAPPDHILLTRPHPTPMMYKFTAVSIVQSELVVSYGVFLGNHCHSRAECTTDGNNGMIEHLKNSPLFGFYAYFWSSNHVWPFEPKCVYNYSVEKKGDWRILYGFCSQWLSIRLTLCFDLSIAD